MLLTGRIASERPYTNPGPGQYIEPAIYTCGHVFSAMFLQVFSQAVRKLNARESM